MTQDHANITARPPRWAESLLGILLPIERHETVMGDLLEEYREVQIPVRGQRGANLWYVRQIAAALWRVAGVVCLAAIAICVAREFTDHLVPAAVTGEYNDRAGMQFRLLGMCYIGAGFWAAWITGRIVSGALAGMLAGGLGWAGTLATDLLLSMLRVPSVYSAVEVEHSASQLALIIPILITGLLTLATFEGVIGGWLGVVARRTTRRWQGRAA